MSVLICLAAAGLIMGIFFNVYILAAACLIFPCASLIFTLGGGAATLGSVIWGLCGLQVGYIAGLRISAFAFPAKLGVTASES